MVRSINGKPLYYLGVVCCLLQGQTASQSSVPASLSPAGAIKVTTRLVQISVVAHDHHGNAVADLTKQEFELTDDGKRQIISEFSVDTFSRRSGSGTSPSPVMPRNIVTNRPERQANTPGSVTVLLLDFYNTALTDQMSGRKQIIKFLHQIQPGDRVAVYVLTGSGFNVIHDFTNNAESLVAALARVIPGYSHELDGSDFTAANTGDDQTDAMLDASNASVANFYTGNRVINTCLSFKALATHLAGISGRKNVVWVSGGFPISFGYGDEQDTVDMATINRGAAQDRELFAQYIEAASQAVNTSNVAIYPVDARGLMGLPMADASRQFKMARGQLPATAMRVDHKNIDTMNYMAELTGGKAFYNSNDIEKAIRKAMDDSEVTYTLGYYVPDSNWNNKYHKIKVRVSRSGINVRTKKGYFAQEQPAPTPAKLARILQDALWSPLDSTTLEVSARIDPSTALPNASRIYFALNAADLQFTSDKDRLANSFDVVFAQQTKKGKLLTDVRQTVNIHVTPEQYSALRAKGITAGRDLAINPDTEAVRIVVLDHQSGLTGSVTVPVTSQDKSGANIVPVPGIGQSETNGPAKGQNAAGKPPDL